MPDFTIGGVPMPTSGALPDDQPRRKKNLHVVNTSKSLDSILTKFMNACCDYEGGIKVDLDKEFENTAAAIVEAVEGIYGDSDGLREFAGLNLIKSVPKVPSKRNLRRE